MFRAEDFGTRCNAAATCVRLPIAGKRRGGRGIGVKENYRDFGLDFAQVVEGPVCN